MWHKVTVLFIELFIMSEDDIRDVRRVIRQELQRAKDNERVPCDSCNGTGRQPDSTSTAGDRCCGKCNGTGRIKRKERWGYQKA